MAASVCPIRNFRYKQTELSTSDTAEQAQHYQKQRAKTQKHTQKRTKKQMQAQTQHLENLVREQAQEIARLRSGGARVGVDELADPPSTQEGWEPTASAAAGGEAEWDMPDLFEDDVWSPGREGYGPAGRKKKGGGAKPKKQASPYRDWRTAAVQ